MTTKLEQLRTMSTIVADTGDIDAVARLRPVDCTTNPTIVLKALGTEAFNDVVEEGVAWGRRLGGSRSAAAAATADRLAVSVGAELLKRVPGRVSTEVDAGLSFDVGASVVKARKIITDYAERGIDRGRVLIKLASTWEGIQAARILGREGVDCNMTLLFNQVQAVASAEAGAFLISPFVGRILDWYRKSTGREYAAEEDPGVQSVRRIYNHFKSAGIATVVMAASFRNKAQIEALAGCDRLTIAPAFLDELTNDEGHLRRVLSPEVTGESIHRSAFPSPVDEATFRWEMNNDQMASEKLSDGIRLFYGDLISLRRKMEERLA